MDSDQSRTHETLPWSQKHSQRYQGLRNSTCIENTQVITSVIENIPIGAALHHTGRVLHRLLEVCHCEGAAAGDALASVLCGVSVRFNKNLARMDDSPHTTYNKRHALIHSTTHLLVLFFMLHKGCDLARIIGAR